MVEVIGGSSSPPPHATSIPIIKTETNSANRCIDGVDLLGRADEGPACAALINMDDGMDVTNNTRLIAAETAGRNSGIGA